MSMEHPASIWREETGQKEDVEELSVEQRGVYVAARIPLPTNVADYPRPEPMSTAYFDVAVVGAGIVGCTVAYNLKKSGLRVALVEARRVGSGVTGHSAGVASAMHGPGSMFHQLVDSHGEKTALEYYHMQVSGVDTIEQLVAELSLECDFQRMDAVLWAAAGREEIIQKEYEAMQQLNIPSNLLSVDGDRDKLKEQLLFMNAATALLLPRQATFNPYKYCVQLCRHIHGDGSRVFEESRVVGITHDHSAHQLKLEQIGCLINSQNVILCTHLPLLSQSLHLSLLPLHWTHCIAVALTDSMWLEEQVVNATDLPEAVLIEAEESSIISWIHRRGTKTALLVSAQDCDNSIKIGQEIDQAHPHYNRLENWARNNFASFDTVVSRWSGIDYHSHDGIPFIGELYSGSRGIYTATGFNGWGLATGVAAANILRDLVLGKDEVRYLHMVDARRWDLKHQWPSLLGETVQTISHLVLDPIRASIQSQQTSVETLGPGQGALVHNEHGQIIGAYRDGNGEVHLVNPLCTHLGCLLSFNEEDQVWSCHNGCQFSCTTGEVLHGPAVRSLKKIALSEKPLSVLKW